MEHKLTRQTLKDALLAIRTERIIANKRGDQIYWGHQWVELIMVEGWAGWWRFGFFWNHRCWNEEDYLERLSVAITPDGSRWEYGCDRWPSWDDGSSAVILEPLRHLLTPEERMAINNRLLVCPCWPEELQLQVNAPPLDQIWTPEELEVVGGG